MEEVFFFATGLVLIVLGALLFLTCYTLSYFQSKRYITLYINRKYALSILMYLYFPKYSRKKMEALILEQRDMPSHRSTMDQEDGPPPEYDTIVHSYTIYQDPPPYIAQQVS